MLLWVLVRLALRLYTRALDSFLPTELRKIDDYSRATSHFPKLVLLYGHLHWLCTGRLETGSDTIYELE
jgi:hypothetical protein